ncbi:hypothetical protein [Streptomyces sp. DSM 15324]|uniref:hypothetical protein n=1 Tax=Streptomyces sp. DSM 15324 TaxID=1739111 RepID=UPI00131DD51D|nr:hypothetical protein [Streptomyces sp. DSM 15324]
MTFSVLSACASEQGSEGKPVGKPVGKPLVKAELERAAITDADLDGYEVEQILAAPSASRRTADPAACAPVVQATGGSSGFTAVARIGRMMSPKKGGSGTSMILASHDAGDAAKVIDALRSAAKRCKSFLDVGVGFRYDDVALRPDPGYGDESVSLRLTQLAAADADDEPVRVPYAVVAVRQGATVAMFYEFNRPRGAGDADAAAVPEDIIRTQLNKLNTLNKPGKPGKPTASK